MVVVLSDGVLNRRGDTPQVGHHQAQQHWLRPAHLPQQQGRHRQMRARMDDSWPHFQNPRRYPRPNAPDEVEPQLHPDFVDQKPAQVRQAQRQNRGCFGRQRAQGSLLNLSNRQKLLR